MPNLMRLPPLATLLLLSLALLLVLRWANDCADPKVSVDATQKPSGLVMLDGHVVNAGTLDYTADSEIVVTMNVRYPPKTYNQSGVSEDVCRKALGKLGSGDDAKFKCTYTIPDFASWTDGGTADALRLFTVWIEKSDHTVHTHKEDCNDDDSRAWVEIGYHKQPQQ
jgi:hypothetical protein